MKQKNYPLITIAALFLCLQISCSKKFLDDNPRTDLILPNNIDVLKALLDDDLIMNHTPIMGELSADNYYMTFTYWQTLLEKHERNSYTWAQNIYEGQQNVDDWSRSYTQILNANVVLDGLGKITQSPSNQSDWNYLKGSALFFRANAYYNLAQIFAPPYDSSSAGTDLGLPIRTDPDIISNPQRETVKVTYESILSYLNEAENLVRPKVEYSYKNRPSKPAVLALKARVYLSMRAYTQAGETATAAIQEYDSLINYNDVDPFALLPFTTKNKETIFQSNFTRLTQVLAAFIFPEVIVDSNLLKLYDAADLRPSIYYTNFFSGQYNLKGSYSGSIYPFTGLAVDELYLIRAEANAWAGNVNAAMDDLNALLVNRFMTGTFTPLTASSREEALQMIRDERRKELAFRGLRWADLRRFNKEGANISLQRVLNGQTYNLAPNSKLYTLPLPPEIIRLGHYVQNDR